MTNPFLSPPSAWMYTLKPTRPAVKTEGPTPEEAAIVAKHWAHVQQLHAAGRLILAGRTLDLGDEGFATIIFRAQSAEKARETMETDPGVVGGVFSGRLHPYQAMLLGTLQAPVPKQ